MLTTRVLALACFIASLVLALVVYLNETNANPNFIPAAIALAAVGGILSLLPPGR
jgi:uncharacterized membrane protein YjjP (DUF1212 family)